MTWHDMIGQKRRKDGTIRLNTEWEKAVEIGKESKPKMPTDANTYGKALTEAIGDFLSFLENKIDPPEGDH